MACDKTKNNISLQFSLFFLYNVSLYSTFSHSRINFLYVVIIVYLVHTRLITFRPYDARELGGCHFQLLPPPLPHHLTLAPRKDGRTLPARIRKRWRVDGHHSSRASRNKIGSDRLVRSIHICIYVYIMQFSGLCNFSSLFHSVSFIIYMRMLTANVWRRLN